MKSGFCACAITFQTQSTWLRFWPVEELAKLVALLDVEKKRGLGVLICLEMQCNKVGCTDLGCVSDSLLANNLKIPPTKDLALDYIGVRLDGPRKS